MAGMVELSATQAISSTTTTKSGPPNELSAPPILDTISVTLEPKRAAAATLLNQVDAPELDQTRVAVVSTDEASNPPTFQAAPETTVEPTKSASAGNIGNRQLSPNGTDLCKNILTQPSTSLSNNYQLRALKADKSTIGEDNLWSRNFNVPSLSSDLISETLNYFVNCRHRLSQITKTFDDSDAYILLLQEKEMDLELVARIGQDLLKQFNEVKDSNEALKEELAKFQDINERLKQELAKCREDNQQLKYELASKVSLLDTFMEEEEEHQNQDTTTVTVNRSETNDDEFNSLRSQTERVVSSNESNLYKRLCELQDELLTKDEILFKQNIYHQERSINLELQLRDSDRRLSGLEAENETLRENQRELYDELKTYSKNFAELLRIFSDLQRNARDHEFCNISNESHLDSMILIQNQRHDTQSHHQTCYNQSGQSIVRETGGGMVLSSSLHEELQESLLRSGEQLSGIDDDEFALDEHDEAEDEGDDSDPVITKLSPTSSPNRHHRSHYKQARYQPAYYQKQHFRRRNQDSDSGGVSDGADSGLHTTISSSTTPINNGLNQETDSDLDANTSRASVSEEAGNKKHWLGLSTFTLTTLLLICLSAALNNTTNSNLAQKLQQIRFDR